LLCSAESHCWRIVAANTAAVFKATQKGKVSIAVRCRELGFQCLYLLPKGLAVVTLDEIAQIVGSIDGSDHAEIKGFLVRGSDHFGIDPYVYVQSIGHAMDCAS
jgi:hypothetical protein